MTRDEEIKTISEIQCSSLILELPTSFGKTLAALKWIKNQKDIRDILIVVPNLVLIDNWKDEINKWCFNDYNYVFSTYVSLPKKLGSSYDAVIFDEAHHITERCAEAIRKTPLKKSVLLSATLGKRIDFIKSLFRDTKVYTIGVRKAIQNGVLPDPEVYLFPLYLNNNVNSETYIINNKGKTVTEIMYKDIPVYSRYFKDKNKKFIIHCTQLQKHQYVCNQIKKMREIPNLMSVFYLKNIYLKRHLDRLKWLSDIKTDDVKRIMNEYCKNAKVLVFCNSIKQCDELCENTIHSKNDDDTVLDKFNNGEIDRVATCNMLNEGVNIRNCQIGLFACLNVSDVMQKQRLGRILRHENPKILIPYYVGTREEEIVNDMAKMYNPELIKKVYL